MTLLVHFSCAAAGVAVTAAAAGHAARSLPKKLRRLLFMFNPLVLKYSNTGSAEHTLSRAGPSPQLINSEGSKCSPRQVGFVSLWPPRPLLRTPRASSN